MATTSGSASKLTGLFNPPERHESTERTKLLKEDASSSLQDLFRPVEVPIKGDEESTEEKASPQPFLESCRSFLTAECLSSTLIGSFTFVLYHVVFCLAQASTITRPHASEPIIGPVAKMAALGILLASPAFVGFLGNDVPAIYPTSDLFLAPFLASLAVTIDETLYQDNLQDDDLLFLSTFTAVSGAGLLLSGLACILAARVKLANLGSYLPYNVLCGFFTMIGILMWTLAFSVDADGLKVGQVITSGDWGLISNSLLHHAPSFCIGAIMHVVGPRNPFFVILLELGSIMGAYLVMWLTGTSLAQAQEMKWFWTAADLVTDVNNKQIGFQAWLPPAPFGVFNALLSNDIHWGAFRNCLQTVIALAFLYLIRCSLHAAALKKNIPNVTRKKPVEDVTKPKNPVSLNKILECGYGYSQLVACISGGIAVAPAVAVSLTLFKLGAEGVIPQFGSLVLLLGFYLTDFQLVSLIPKSAFSCLLVLAFFDMVSTWLIQSFKKTKQKWEWMVTPLIVVLSFSVGLLNAIFLGVAFSTIVFVGSFYRTGVVKYLGNGLTLRSTIERGYRDAAWLDDNGDLIQILVLQNYLFFGNAQSLLSYITTMFEEPGHGSVANGLDVPLPPPPKYILIDFTIVSGMDTSAVDLLSETVTLCKNNRCRLFLSGMSGTLRSNLVYAGVKPDEVLCFQQDLDSSLGKAEDGLLRDVLHNVEQEEYNAGVRRRARTLSHADDGFRYALEKIDEQHGLDYAKGLVNLEKYTKVVELLPGESLFQDEGGRVSEKDRGFFFVESGIMTIERDVIDRSRNAGSLRVPLSNAAQIQQDPTSSIGHLNARTPTIGKEDSIRKKVRRAERAVQSFRLARIGTGWVVGSLEGCTSGLRNPGVHIAVTACRLHLLPFCTVRDVIEKTDPALAIHLYKLLSHLSSRRQEMTIDQLTQYLTIMSSPAHRSESMTRVTLASL